MTKIQFRSKFCEFCNKEFYPQDIRRKCCRSKYKNYAGFKWDYRDNITFGVKKK